jgi:hypothetical protein
MLSTSEHDDSEPQRTRKVRVQSPSPNTSDAENECDDGSPVGSPCCSVGGTMRHIDTDYSPSYIYENRQLSFFPVPASPVVTHSPMVMNSTMFAPIPCGLQFVNPAPMYVASPPYVATGGPSMMLQPKSTSSNTRTPLRATAAPYIHAPDRAVAPQPDVANDVADCRKTSILLRNLPDGFTRTMLMDVLRAQGLARHVDFLYVPADFKNMANYGYAFVNLSTPEAAEECLEKLGGFSGWGMPSDSACETSWCTTHQGLHAYIERYRNSRIMHENVDDEYKPAVFKNGIRIRFPCPTKVIRAPRLRKEESR